jgi:FdhE protein
MSTHDEFGPELVRRAAASLAAIRPSYAELIGFYGDIFIAQEDARLRIRFEPFRLAPDRVAIKLRDRFPLIQPAEMRFDPREAAVLFNQLCRIAMDRSSKLAAPAEILSRHPTQIPPLFQSFLDEDSERVAAAAAALDVDPQALSFFLYHSLRPAFCTCAQELADLLGDFSSWEQGYCPVCGSLPALAWIEGDGQRYLHCGFCWQRWPMPRLLCPHCGARDPQQLSYRTSEAEKEYRLDLCAACRTYIKTVDARHLARPGYPPLEQVASLHFDIQASAAGFEPILPIIPPV